MKTLAIFSVLLGATILCLAADDKPIPGPRGGKLLENSAPHAEFVIENDNRVTVAFYDEKLKSVPIGEQVVVITAEPKSGNVNLKLEKKDGLLVSKEPLPKSRFFDEYEITVQIRNTPEAKPETFKIRFDLDVCGRCKLKEYACTCRH
jgi:hypothetical protein